MTPRPLTDATLAAALRRNLPAAAQAGLQDRILAEIEHTPQERPLPSILGRITDADEFARRRVLLLVALLALALSLSLAVAVGALLLRERDAPPDLSLEPPADVDAFVLASYGGYAELPAFRVRIEDLEGTVDVYYYDGAGSLRQEHPGGDPDPSIWTPDGFAYWYSDAQAWVVGPTNEHALARLAEHLGASLTGCESGWDHVAVEAVLDRPVHRVRCVTDDPGLGVMERELWLDIATGLVLRAAAPVYAVDEAGSPLPMPPVVNEATEFELGPQPAALFAIEGPTMSLTDYDCFLGFADGCQSPGPSGSLSPEPSSTPPATPAPAPGDWAAPADIDAFIADVFAAYAEPSSLTIEFDTADANLPYVVPERWQRDGLGNYRAENDNDLADDVPGVALLAAGGRSYETDPRPDGRTWRDWGPGDGFGIAGSPTHGLPERCTTGWQHLGVDVVLDRPAHHLLCAFREFWIDVEWRLVTRAHDRDPLLGVDPAAGLTVATSVSFEPLPAELFAAPDPDDTWSSP